MPTDFEIDAAHLILASRWAAIATVKNGAPLASMVAYAPEAGLQGVLLFLSELSQHTQNLLDDPRVSLVVSSPDSGRDDPQLLPRATVTGEARPLPNDGDAFREAQALYLSQFPDAEMRFGLADFHLFRLVPAEIRYVGGFARAFSMTPAELTDAAGAVSRERSA